jgi:hypothetical protein
MFGQDFGGSANAAHTGIEPPIGVAPVLERKGFVLLGNDSKKVRHV